MRKAVSHCIACDVKLAVDVNALQRLPVHCDGCVHEVNHLHTSRRGRCCMQLGNSMCNKKYVQ